uniref:Uncharacterized protein n=1 Tax=Meloidogyne enterolobii TaxID=390850 RepID=A0A6V7VYC8_MELEN|nr:unnamed protein product [Meloidogyne enterolobii]
MDIKRNSTCIDSYTNNVSINSKKNTTMCFNHTNLIENELIKLILTFGNSSFQVFYILETKENFVENNVTLDIPISLTEYINVEELDNTDISIKHG